MNSIIPNEFSAIPGRMGKAGKKDQDPAAVRTCRVCGCTDDDCRQCLRKTGHPCHWVEADLCSACIVTEMEKKKRPASIKSRKDRTKSR